MVDAQRYKIVGFENYRNAKGQDKILLVWLSHCADCGEPFTIKTGLICKWPNRRCKKHARPGKAASPAARKKQHAYLRKLWRRS